MVLEVYKKLIPHSGYKWHPSCASKAGQILLENITKALTCSFSWADNPRFKAHASLTIRSLYWGKHGKRERPRVDESFIAVGKRSCE